MYYVPTHVKKKKDTCYIDPNENCLYSDLKNGDFICFNLVNYYMGIKYHRNTQESNERGSGNTFEPDKHFQYSLLYSEHFTISKWGVPQRRLKKVKIFLKSKLGASMFK